MPRKKKETQKSNQEKTRNGHRTTQTDSKKKYRLEINIDDKGRILNKKGKPYPPSRPELTSLHKKIVAILGNRLGRENAIRMQDLANMVGICDRRLRNVINELKWKYKIPILSWDNFEQGGYYLARNKSDQAKCLEMFMSRIWTSLKNVATIKGISLMEAGEFFAVELTEKTEEGQKKEFMKGLPKPPRGYSLITALVKKVQNDPDKYQKDLHALQNAFGAKFIERKKLKELAAIREQLNGICTELEG